MSKINLTPNASGTGVFTIASPNSNTDRTLNLPEESGTVITTQSPQLGRRNLIINGAMNVAQRGTSIAVSTTGVYTLDRFICDEFTDGALTVSQDTDAPNDFNYSLKVTPSTADTSIASSQYARIRYRPEGFDLTTLAFGTSNAKSLAFSFYAKSNKAGTYCIAMDLLGGTERTYIKEISLTNTWSRYVINIPANTVQAINNSTTGAACEIDISLAVGSDYHGTTEDWTNTGFATSNQVNFMDSTANELYITGVQLEVGDVATPFENRSYGEELALCQRYFFKTTGTVQGGGLSVVTQPLDSIIGVNENLPVTMRASPTLTMLGTTYRTGGDADGQNVTPTHITWGRKKTGSGTANVGAYAMGGFQVEAEL